jgi:hypothetical protein
MSTIKFLGIGKWRKKIGEAISLIVEIEDSLNLPRSLFLKNATEPYFFTM